MKKATHERVERHPITDELATALIELEGVCKQRGITFKEAAKAISVSPSSLSRARKGESPWRNQQSTTQRIRHWITRPDEIWMLEKYIKDTGTSEAAMARRLNISASTLNMMLTGNYFRNIPRVTGGRVLPKIRDFLWNIQAKTENTSVSFLNTSVAKKIFEVCCLARNDRKKIMLIACRPGTGKTMALKRFQFENPGTILVECHIGMGRNNVLKAVAEVSKVRPGTTTDITLSRLLERFSNSEELIIIDEANHLNRSQLEILRYIKDQTGVGMLLSGTHELLRKLEQGGGDNLEQLADRIKIKVDIKSIKRSDSDIYVGAALPHLNGKLTEDLLSTFYALSDGKMRLLENIVGEAVRIARINQRDIDKQCIEAAWKLCTQTQTN